MHALSCFLHSLMAAINNVLLQTAPNVNESQLQLIDTVHTTFIHSLLHNTPDLIIQQIQAWAVWWPDIRTNEVWHFFL